MTQFAKGHQGITRGLWAASPQDTVAESSGLLQLDTLTSGLWGIMESQTLFFRQEGGKGSVLSKPGGTAWPWHSCHSPWRSFQRLGEPGLGSKLQTGVEAIPWDGTSLALGEALLSFPLSFVYSGLGLTVSKSQL